MSNLLKV